MKVLVSAYVCEPGKGSEPGVGWNWVKQIARFHEVWVITRENYRAPITQHEDQAADVHWAYFDLPFCSSHQFWRKRLWAEHIYYYLWQIGAYFVGKRLSKEVRFDLAHHVTYGIYWRPSFLNSSNLLIEDCQFLWNNWSGLGLALSPHITVRGNAATHNGASGMEIVRLTNLLLEDNETSYNKWWGAKGGYTGWSVAGIKNGASHTGVYHWHRAVGNQTRGFWCDTDCVNM